MNITSSSRVVFFVGSLRAGGLERFVTRVSIEAVRLQLFTPIVFCLDKREGIFVDELESVGVRVLQAPGNWQRNPIRLLQFCRLVKRETPVVIHSQVNFSLFQQWLVSLFGTRPKMLVTERNCYPLSGWSRLRKAMQFHWLRIMGVSYSANSTEVAKHLSRQVKYSARELHVITNGIEVREVDLKLRTRIRESMGWKESDFVIGYVARFAEHKGHSYFLDVMECLMNEDPRFKICLVGEGPTLERVKGKVAKLGIHHRCLFTGVIADLPSYYSAFDCTALFSEYEGMPNVVLEAMASGLPVVANPVGNVVELFVQDSGILNVSTNPEETARLFVVLLRDPVRRRQVGDNARRRVADSFSISSTLTSLLNEYNG